MSFRCSHILHFAFCILKPSGIAPAIDDLKTGIFGVFLSLEKLKPGDVANAVLGCGTIFRIQFIKCLFQACIHHRFITINRGSGQHVIDQCNGIGSHLSIS